MAKQNIVKPAEAEGSVERQNPPVIGVARKEEDQPAIPDVLPILPIRGLVVFPGTVVPLTIRRPSSLKLLDESLPQSKIIGLVTQHTDVDTPTPDDIYKVGVAVVVLKLLRQANDSI